MESLHQRSTRIVPRGPVSQESDGSPLGWALLRQRMFGGDAEIVTEEALLAAWRRDVRAVIEGRML